MTRLKGAFTIKAQLADIKNPPVWRHIRINGTATFADLHQALQEAFGWLDYHLHSFQERDTATFDSADGLHIEPRFQQEYESVYSSPAKDEETVQLDQMLPYYPRHLDYEYDFGDSWIHHLTVEAWHAGTVKNGGKVYEIVDGNGAAPPEDCGGPYRFCELRDCLAKAKKEGVDLGAYDPSDLRTDLDYAVAAQGSNFNPRDVNRAPDWYRDYAEPDIER